VSLGQKLHILQVGLETGTGKDGTLNKYANSIAHKNAEVTWHQYRENMKQGTTIPERYNSNRTATIMQNRHCLRSILQALLYCAHQKIALRGHPGEHMIQ